MLSLQAVIAAQPIAAEVLDFGTPMPTVTLAAEAAGVAPNVIVKTLILQASNGRYVAVVLAGDQRLDFDKVQRHIGVAKLRFASHADVLRVTGYPAGGTPPFGHVQPIPTLVDAAVMREPFVLGGGGRVELLVKIEPATLVAVARATIGDFAKQPGDNGRTTMSDGGRPFAVVS